MRFYKQIFLFFIFLLLTSCQTGKQADEEKELTIAAAANFIHAFEEIRPMFEEQMNVKVTYSFGASGQLKEQIEHGAPFDIFASANEEFVKQLELTNKVISDTTKVFALGRIGVATLDEKFTIHTLEDLLDENIYKIAIANPEHAPFGRAAKEALESAGVWDEISPKLVYARNISDAVTYLESGNVEAAFIALSLVQPSFQFTLIDEEQHQPLNQTIAVVEGSTVANLGQAFINYVMSEEGQAIMETYGFTKPGE